MLDLENVEDPECIDAINESIFTSYFQKNDKLLFHKLILHKLVMGGLYGIDSWHKGYGKMMA